MSCQQVPTTPAFNLYPRSVQVGEFEVAIDGGIWVAIRDISFLKIDRAFVRDLETNTANQTLCRAIIMMAHGLNIQVIAEGVETRGQADLLASLECDYGQGYYFARPVSPEAFGRLLEEGLSVSVPIKGQIGL